MLFFLHNLYLNCFFSFLVQVWDDCKGEQPTLTPQTLCSNHYSLIGYLYISSAKPSHIHCDFPFNIEQEMLFCIVTLYLNPFTGFDGKVQGERYTLHRISNAYLRDIHVHDHPFPRRRLVSQSHSSSTILDLVLHRFWAWALCTCVRNKKNMLCVCCVFTFSWFGTELCLFVTSLPIYGKFCSTHLNSRFNFNKLFWFGLDVL